MRNHLVVCMFLASLGPSVHQGIAMSEDARANNQPALKKPVTPLIEVYDDTTPDFTSAVMGHFSMDVALVDFDRDTYPDLLISNGSDMGTQQLILFRNWLPDNYRKAFRPWPDWSSDVSEYMAGMAVGDVNEDGWMDVAVAVAFDKSRDISTGSVKVFLNINGELQPRPAFETAQDGFMPVDCALADVDADGDLDLIVPALVEGRGIWAVDGPSSYSPGRVRIYLNRDGTFLRQPPDVIIGHRLGAGSVTAADINQDGWIDLAFGSPQPTIFYGKPAPPNHITISDKAGWIAATPPVKAEIPLYRIDAGSPEKVLRQSSALPARGAGLMLAVSPGCATSLDRPCKSSFFLYRPDRESEPIWTSNAAHFTGGIALADINQDGFLDLVTGQWGTSLPGGPLWFFQGPFKRTTTSKPTMVIDRPRVWQAFSVANVHCEPFANELLRHTFTIKDSVNVLTLPQRIISEVRQVSQDGSPMDHKLWTWSPDSNWISLAKPVADTVITVTYKSPTILDLAGATWNPEFGSDVYFSFLKSCP